MKQKTLEFLESHQSETPSTFTEDAKLCQNKSSRVKTFSDWFQYMRRNRKNSTITESETEIFDIINKEIKDYRNNH